MPAHIAARHEEGGGEPERGHEPGDEEEFHDVDHERHPTILRGGFRNGRRYPWPMEPEAAEGGGEAPPPPGPAWQPGIPSLREHLPSLVFGAALPIGVYFLVRPHVGTDATALVVAGGFSVAWILLQGIRRRTVDVVGAVVLLGFVVGVVEPRRSWAATCTC